MALRNAVPLPSGPISRPRRPEFKAGGDPLEGTLTDEWQDYFGHQTDLTEKFPGRVATVDLVDQSTNVGATDLSEGILSAGFYSFRYWLGVTTAGTGGTITLTLSWTYRSQTYTYTAVVNAAVAFDSTQAVVPVVIDGLSPVTYALTFAGLGDGVDLRLTFEEVEA